MAQSTNAIQNAPLQSRKDYKSTPQGQYEYWNIEFKAAQKMLAPWHKQAHEITQRYLDTREGAGVPHTAKTTGYPSVFKLNLFHANTKTIYNMMYGQLPKIDVSRRNAVADDDPGRVAALAMERMLNLDLQENGKEVDTILRAVLLDRLSPGLGCARVRYKVETGDVPRPNNVTSLYGDASPSGGADMPKEEGVIDESVPFDYYFWEDMLWGWSRTFGKLPWIGFKSYLTKDAAEKRFGKEIADQLPLKKQTATSDEAVSEPQSDSPWMKAEIWEIWDKKERKIVWYCDGFPEILDTKDDTLKLEGFYPCPPFFMANQTSHLYKPTPDYHLSQDLYNEIDILSTRISIITEAVKVVGVYDASAEGIQRIFKEGMENDLIPVDNWALFAEKGGIQGQVDWVPLDAITEALDKLRQMRDESIQLLQQVSGMADVMRGQLDNQYEGVGQTQVKAKFGSVRIQALQEEFASFVGDLMQLKAEVIAKHFSPQTIVKQSALQMTPDAELLPQAVKLIKNHKEFKLRVSVKPESLAMLDYAQLREERAEYLTGLSKFMQAAAPMIEQDKRALPFMLEMLKWAMAGFKGAAEVEGIMDKAIDELKKQPPEQDKPSPEETRSQAQVELEKMRQQGKQQEQEREMQNEMQIREHDRQEDIQTKQAEMQFSLQLEEGKANTAMRVMQAKLETDVQTELLTSQINSQQHSETVQGDIRRELIKQHGAMEQLRFSKSADARIEGMKKGADLQISREKPEKTK